MAYSRIAQSCPKLNFSKNVITDLEAVQVMVGNPVDSQDTFNNLEGVQGVIGTAQGTAEISNDFLKKFLFLLYSTYYELQLRFTEFF